MKKNLLGLLLGGALLLPLSTAAYFQDLGMGVRPEGMGEAFTAVADDSNAMTWNIAGIADLQARELNLMYADLYSNMGARLYTGETDVLGVNNVALVLPFDKPVGSFGFTWLQFRSKIYQENSYIFGYAREVGADIFNWFNASDRVKQIQLNAGMNLKILNWAVTANDYTATNDVFSQNGLSRTGFTADLGLLATWTENVRFGMSLENFVPANMGMTIYETVPIDFRFGMSYLHDFKGSIQYLDSVLGAVDFTQRYGISDIRAGVEATFFRQFISLRAGTTVDEFTTGLSVNAFLPQTPIDLRVDYAFILPYNIQSTWGSHRISLIIRWGEQKPKTQMVVLEPEENMAKQQDKQLAAARAEEEAKLKAIITSLRLEIEEVRKGLEAIQARVEAGELPRVEFESKKSVLKKSSLKTLDAMGALLELHPQVKVRIEGYTDNQGEARTNLKLSQARVEAVKEYFLALFKLKANNLIPVGYGDTRAVASNATPEGRDKNQRVEVKALTPKGLETAPAPAAVSGAKPEAKEMIRPEDIVSYEDVEALREKIKVYELQMNPQEVEDLFKQKYQEEENGKAPAPKKP